MKYLSQNLKYLREKQNYSQDDISKQLFVTHQTISNHETGKSEPSLDLIQKYAVLYGVDFHDLIQVDLSKKQISPLIIFDSIIFDRRNKTFVIIDGTQGTYPYHLVKSCKILHEKAKYRGKSQPFSHIVITGVRMMVQMGWLEPRFYVGLRLELKDGRILGVYTSKEATNTNSDIHISSYEEAIKIKNYFDKIIKKYS